MNTIRCPHCHQPIDIDQVLAHQIEEQVVAKNKQQLAAQEQKLKLELWQKAQEEAKKKSDVSVKELQQRLQEQEKRAQDAEMNELEMRKKQRQLEEKEKQLQLELERQLDARLHTEL